MRKKIIYISIFIILIILGYFNYFAEDKEITGNQQVIETTNVIYKNDDYTVEAEKQKDYMRKKETEFEKAKAKVNDMFLSGDNVLIDKVRNLALKNNIFGVSPNGWNFKAQEANYNKLKDEITSTTGVMAENKEKGVKISGINFTTNSKMNYINLEKDVVLENKDLALIGDKGSYDDFTKLITLSDNIRLEGRGNEANQIDGHFKTLKYDMQNKVLQAWEPFDISYKGTKLNAEKLYLKEDTQELNVSKNVSIEVEGFKIKVDNIKKSLNSDLLIFNGPIQATSSEYYFEANQGEYNIKTRVFKAFGKIKGRSKDGAKLSADTLIYDTQDKVLTLVSNKNIEYISKDGVLTTQKIIYNLQTKELRTPGKYSFDGPEYESKGEELYYDENSKDIVAKDGYIENKIRKQRVSGNLMRYNLTTKDTDVEGEVNFKNNDFNISTSKFIYDGKTQIALIPNFYEVKLTKTGFLFSGEKAQYNQLENEFMSEGKVIGKGNNYVVVGEKLEYNTKLGLGKIGSKVLIENKQKHIKITADKFSFEKDKIITLAGKLNIETEKFILNSEKANYSINEKKIYIPNSIEFHSKDGKTEGMMDSGVYVISDSIFIGKNFNGSSEKNKISSNEMKYYDSKNKIVFIGNVVMTGENTVIKGSEIEYHTNSEEINIIGNYIIYYKEFIFKGINGNFNKLTGVLVGERAEIISETGDRFVANEMYGNLKEMILDFKGNIHGTITNKGKITTFSGENARIYFKKDNKYEIFRSEITKDAKFIQGDKILESNYIEIDLTKNLIFSKDGTKLTIENSKTGKSVVTANTAEMNNNKNIIILTGNLKIENRSKKYGITYVTSEKGIINQENNILEFVDNVKIENNDSIIQADKGIYNMNTKKIKALGDVYVDYKK